MATERYLASSLDLGGMREAKTITKNTYTHNLLLLLLLVLLLLLRCCFCCCCWLAVMLRSPPVMMLRSSLRLLRKERIAGVSAQAQRQRLYRLERIRSRQIR